MADIKRVISLTVICIMLTITTAPISFADEDVQMLDVGSVQAKTMPEGQPGTDNGEQPGAETAGRPDTSPHTITGFKDLPVREFYYEGNPKEEELVKYLPESIEVYLDNSKKTSSIPVSWSVVEDYEDSSFFFYSVKPSWPSNYKLSSSLVPQVDVPWITVFWEPSRQEMKKGEKEPEVPVGDPDELEPVYTVKDGSVDPSQSSDPVSMMNIFSAFTEESYAASSVSDRVFAYLTKNMGLNTAAACGVMTNLYAESALRSNNLENYYNRHTIALSDEEYTKRVNAGKASNGKYTSGNNKTRYFTKDYCGYGIAQWTSLSRRTNLLRKAIAKKTSIDNLNMQLEFLKDELQYSYPHVWATLKGVPNNAGGAYLAAAEFCACFEIPANTYSTATSRAKTAVNTYWKNYTGRNDSVNSASFIGLCGYAYPQYVRRGEGMDVSGYVISNYSITNVTARITNLSGKTIYSTSAQPKAYFYKLSRMDSALKFAGLPAGTYRYILAAKDSSGKTVTASHAFTAVSSGKTTSLKGFSAGKVITAAPKPKAPGVLSKLPAPVSQTKPAAAKPAVKSAAKPVKPAPPASKLKITNFTYPKSLKKGQTFTIKGKVSSNVKLKKVIAGIYTASGKSMSSASKKVSKKSFNLKKLDEKIRFGKLPKGTFYYTVTATDRKQTKVLLKRAFTVK